MSYAFDSCLGKFGVKRIFGILEKETGRNFGRANVARAIASSC
jgi:hypothetical protein